MDNGQALRHIDGIGPEWAVKIRKGEVHDPKKAICCMDQAPRGFCSPGPVSGGGADRHSGGGAPLRLCQRHGGRSAPAAIYCTDRPGKVVSLTFDAAWGDEDTQQLIEILGKYKVRATFFVVGEWVDRAEIRSRPCSTRGMKS